MFGLPLMSLLLGRDVLGHDLQFRPLFPPDFVPKLLALLVVAVQEDVAFLDSDRCQAGQTHFHQPPTQPSATMLPSNCQMMKVTPPSVMATQDGANQLSIQSNHQAQSEVAGQEGLDAFSGVGIAQAHAFGALP